VLLRRKRAVTVEEHDMKWILSDKLVSFANDAAQEVFERVYGIYASEARKMRFCLKASSTEYFHKHIGHGCGHPTSFNSIVTFWSGVQRGNHIPCLMVVRNIHALP